LLVVGAADGHSQGLAAAGFDNAQPQHLNQVPAGPPRTPNPGTPRGWAVAEWRHGAAAELATILTGWEHELADRTADGKLAAPRLTHLRRWDFEARSSANASTELLPRYQVVAHEASSTALVVVPAPVAAWRRCTGKAGRNGFLRSTQNNPAGEIVDLGEAGPSDTPRMLETLYRLWHDPRPLDSGQQAGTVTHWAASRLRWPRPAASTGQARPTSSSGSRGDTGGRCATRQLRTLSGHAVAA
jgi:hypothetical protein